MVEVLLCFKDVEYLKSVSDFLNNKKQYSVWDVVNKDTLLKIINDGQIITNDLKVIITDSDNKQLLETNLNCNSDYYIIYVSDELSFVCKEENAINLLKTNNYEAYHLTIQMFIKNKNINNFIDIKDKIAKNEYNKLLSKLNKELDKIYSNSSDLLNNNGYIIISGNKGTGKTYLSKLLAKSNTYILLNEYTENIETLLFGDISDEQSIKDMVSQPIYIIIDNFDKLSEKIQMRIIGAIKYKVYNKNNSNRQYHVNANFIINSTIVPKILNRFDINNIINLPDVNDYHYMNKILFIYNVIGITNKIAIQRQVIDYISNYDYSTYGIETLEDIGRHIKKNLNDSETIKVEHLPSWLTSKIPHNSFGIAELRQISDNGIFDLKEVEKLVIQGAYKKCLFVKDDTAKLLGIAIGTLNNKLKLYNINVEDLIEN